MLIVVACLSVVRCSLSVADRYSLIGCCCGLLIVVCLLFVVCRVLFLVSICNLRSIDSC